MDKQALDGLFDLTGRVAIVTGGTRGIGRAHRRGFVAAGAKVVVASRKADACAETEAHLAAPWAARRSACRRTWASSTRSDRLVDAHGRPLRRRRHRREQRGQRAAEPLGQFTAEAWEKSYRREPARPGVPRAGGAART